MQVLGLLSASLRILDVAFVLTGENIQVREHNYEQTSVVSIHAVTRGAAMSEENLPTQLTK